MTTGGALLVASLCFLSLVNAAHVFTGRDELITARTEWCVDKSAAVTNFGPINNWDVSRITDLSSIFCASGSADCYSGCAASRLRDRVATRPP